MKKSEVLFGIFAPLYCQLVFNFMMYTEVSIKFELIQNIIFLLLPVLPGVVMVFVLIRNSLQEYFESLVFCFVLSLIVFFIYEALNINLRIFKAITGYDEFSDGDGLLFLFTFFFYIVSCTAGAVVSGIISLYRQIKSRKSNKKPKF